MNFLKLKKITALVLGISGFTAAGYSQDDIFVTEHAVTSSVAIEYNDLHTLLQTNVLNVGRSEHTFERPFGVSTGSRFKPGNRNPSRLEGNRVFFHALSDANLNYLSSIRWRLESIPEQIDFTKLTKNQQLAYWLNLHNITVYENLARAYPLTKVQRFIFGKKKCIWLDCNDPTSLLEQATIEIKGQEISLNDIQQHVFTNWSEPMVIYGFFFGAIGTPNIRPEAYKAEFIWEQLQDNAEEFVNSIRGTQIKSHTLRISQYYKRTAMMFPDFDKDIRAHLLKYSDDDFKTRIEKTRKIKATISDWTTVDFLQGKPEGTGRYINLNKAGPNTIASKPHLKDFAERVIKRFQKLKPEVSVEEVDIPKEKKPE